MAEIVRHRPGEPLPYVNRADVVLTARREKINRLIYHFQRRRYPEHLAWVTHAAMIRDSSGALIEAVAGGVQVAHLEDYADWTFYVIKLGIPDSEREPIAAKMESMIGWSYGYWELALAGWYLLTGHRPPLDIPRQVICSAAVTESLRESERYEGIYTPTFLNSPAYTGQFFGFKPL